MAAATGRKFRRFRIIQPAALEEEVRQKKPPKQYTVDDLPKWLRVAVVNAGFESIDNENERAQRALLILYKRGMVSPTAKKLYNKLKSIYFPTTDFKVKNLEFDCLKPAQTRFESFGDIEKIYAYCVDELKSGNKNTTLLLILFLFYSGLRTSEALRIKVSTLIELQRRNPVIAFRRKLATEWTPVYNKHLNELVDVLLVKTTHLPPEANVWEPCYETHLKVLKRIYVNIFHTTPPYGFGLHHSRYYAASKLRMQQQSALASKYLGHSNPLSIYKYFKNDKRTLQNRLADFAKQESVYNCV